MFHAVINILKILFLFCLLTTNSRAQRVSGMPTVPKIAPSPKNNPLTRIKINLGKKLFFDPRLSITGKISCHSCHAIVVDEKGQIPSGTDNRNVSTGIDGLKGTRNAPTVWNAGLRSDYFWDGRAKSLEEQAIGPLINPVEMGMPNYEAVLKIIEDIPGYVDEFKKVFSNDRPKSGGHQQITIEEVGKAIAAYERTLMTPDSPFDLFQKGNKKTLSSQAKRGWKTFYKRGCIGCHGSPTFTGKDNYIKFPRRYILTKDYDYVFDFTKDKGRFMSTGERKDINSWRVPSLRNVAVTYPYFHNGAINELKEAVRIMGKTQLGIILEESEVADIVEFLKSLTGKVLKVTKPILPGLK